MYSQWTLSLMEAVNGVSSVAELLARHWYSAPLSESFVTTANSDETMFPFVVTIAPVLTSSSRTNHFRVGIGLPPFTTQVRRCNVPALMAVFSWYPKIEGGSGGSVSQTVTRDRRETNQHESHGVMECVPNESSELSPLWMPVHRHKHLKAMKLRKDLQIMLRTDVSTTVSPSAWFTA